MKVSPDLLKYLRHCYECLHEHIFRMRFYFYLDLFSRNILIEKQDTKGIFYCQFMRTHFDDMFTRSFISKYLLEQNYNKTFKNKPLENLYDGTLQAIDTWSYKAKTVFWGNTIFKGSRKYSSLLPTKQHEQEFQCKVIFPLWIANEVGLFTDIFIFSLHVYFLGEQTF